MNRVEKIYADQGIVGTLAENGGAWQFTYDEEWLNNPERFSLSPSLPMRKETFEDNGSFRPVQWFFDNLLPEGGIRNLMAKESGISGADAFGFLQAFGRETFGCFSVGQQIAGGSLVPLPFEELEARIQRIPRVPLDRGAPKKMSLAGAQPKLLVVYRDGQIFEPAGSEASTHILKPLNSSDGYPDTVINEYFCMRLAGKCKLEVPEVALLHTPSPVYLIERFDRERTPSGSVKRTHAIDGAQLLSMHGEAKYSFDASDLRKCIELSSTKANTRLGLLKWTIFNTLIGNADAHIKNISFIVNARGIRLSPMYDLVSTASYTMPQDHDGEVWPHVKLTVPVGNANYFSEITRQDITQFAEDIGFNPAAAEGFLEAMIFDVRKQSAKLEQELDAIPEVSEGEKRRVRVIRHSVINYMTDRLSQAPTKISNMRP